MACGGVANGGAQVGIDDRLPVIRSDALEDISGFVAVQVIDEGSVHLQIQSLARRRGGVLLLRLRTNGEHMIHLERGNNMRAFRERLARHAAEIGEYADAARRYVSH